MRRLKITFNAPVVLWFVIFCAMATCINNWTHGLANQLLFSTYHSPLTSPLTYVRFFTHVLGHADWEHFLGNMSYLLILGPMLEEKHGGKTLIKVIVITALVTGIVNYICFPATALCGASGVVFAFILLTSFTGFRSGEIPITFILVAVFYFGQQIIAGLTIQDNISNITHIVGGVIGSIIGYNLNKRRR